MFNMNIKEYLAAMWELRKTDKYFEFTMILIVIYYICMPIVFFTFVYTQPMNSFIDLLKLLFLTITYLMIPIIRIKATHHRDIVKIINKK